MNAPRETNPKLSVVPNKTMRPTPAAAFGVSIAAPARLHLGFIDLSGSRGRRFGSVGLTIEGLTTQVSAQVAAHAAVHGPDALVNQRAQHYLDKLAALDLLPHPVLLQVEQHAPAHAGFGSGTQLALAVARAVKELLGLSESLATLARLLERGARSGVGLGAFEQGGFLVDGGHAVSTSGVTQGDTPPPLLARAMFPSQWRVLLILQAHCEGLHGQAERAAFEALPAFTRAAAEQLSHAVLMQALPALAEHDVQSFGAAITELQQVVGDYFAPAQGGRYSSTAVSQVLNELAQAGVAGYGQSSWGPTGFAVFASDDEAQAWVTRLKASHPALQFQVVSACNHGAEVTRRPVSTLQGAAHA
jgi:beta-RFAP synthase